MSHIVRGGEKAAQTRLSDVHLCAPCTGRGRSTFQRGEAKFGATVGGADSMSRWVWGWHSPRPAHLLRTPGGQTEAAPRRVACFQIRLF